jgi:glycopeptide antibiotics resistance protein
MEIIKLLQKIEKRHLGKEPRVFFLFLFCLNKRWQLGLEKQKSKKEKYQMGIALSLSLSLSLSLYIYIYIKYDQLLPGRVLTVIRLISLQCFKLLPNFC